MSQRQRKARAKQRRHAPVLPSRRNLLATGGVALGATLAIGGVAQADTFQVNSNDPYDTGDGVLSLTEAIQQANDNAGADLITFASSVTGAIVLDGDSLPQITDDLNIQGPGAGSLAIDGSFQNQIFDVSAPTTISGLTLKGGYEDGDGGAIFTSAPLVLDGMTLKNNHAESDGGAVGSDDENGSITIKNSTLSDNRSDDAGGAVYAEYADVTLEGTTVSANHSRRDGGGLYAEWGDISLTSSTVSGNESGSDGGGVMAKYGVATLTSSKVVDNTAQYDGGGVSTTFGSIALDGTSVSGNTGEDGGGLFAFYGDGINVGNGSAISGNTARFDGGGIYSQATDVDVDSSTITGNVAATPESEWFENYGAYGGGIAMGDGGASLTVAGSSITDNAANGVYSAGGGIFSDGVLNVDSSTISGNQAANGGGVYMHYTEAEIGNSKVSGNKATTYAGGGLAGYEFAAFVDSSTISGNAARYGGGVAAQYGGMLFDHSTVSGNTAELGGGLAARSLYYLGVGNSSISGNAADFAGGVYGGNVAGLIYQSTLANNTAKHGAGGLAAFGSLVDMETSTVAGNSAGENDDSFGGGLLDISSLSLLHSSTIAHNAAEYAGGVYAEGLGGPIVSQHGRDLAAAASARSQRAAQRLERRKARAAARAAKLDARLTAEGKSAAANHAARIGTQQQSHVRRSTISEGALLDCGLPAALENSIIADNTAAHSADDQDLLAPNVASLFSLVESTTSTLDDLGVGGSNIVGVDPKLGSLRDNGGPTDTIRPLSGSPALNTGSTNDLDLPCPYVREELSSLRKSVRARGAKIAATTQDQRGFDRPVGAAAVTFPFDAVDNLADGADMGAVEIQPGELDAAGTSGGGGDTTPQQPQSPPGPSDQEQNSSAPSRVQAAFKALLARLQNGHLNGNHLAFTDLFPEDGSAIYALDLSFFNTGGARSAKVHAPIHLASKRINGKAGQVKVNIRLSKRALKLLQQHPGGHLVVRSHYVSAESGKSATTRRPLKVRRPRHHRIK